MEYWHVIATNKHFAVAEIQTEKHILLPTGAYGFWIRGSKPRETRTVQKQEEEERILRDAEHTDTRTRRISDAKDVASSTVYRVPREACTHVRLYRKSSEPYSHMTLMTFFFLLSCCTHTTTDLLVTASRTCTINIVGRGQYTQIHSITAPTIFNKCVSGHNRRHIDMAS